MAAKEILRLRRKRDSVFGSIFGEPAWDVLLDLFVAHKERRFVSVSSACIAASVPATTALRWLTVLINEGLIERRPSPEDARVVFVRLTPVAVERMTKLLPGAEELGRPDVL